MYEINLDTFDLNKQNVSDAVQHQHEDQSEKSAETPRNETSRGHEKVFDEQKSSDDIATNSETATDSDSAAEPDSASVVDAETPEVKKTKAKKETEKTASSHLRFPRYIQELVQLQAEKYGVSQSTYLTVLVRRNVVDADKAGFKNELELAKSYQQK